MEALDWSLEFRIALVLAMAAFLPLMACTYCWFRREQRQIEVRRLLRVLRITSEYRKLFAHDIHAGHYSIAVGFTTGLTLLGLGSLFLGEQANLAVLQDYFFSNPYITDAKQAVAFRQGAILVFGTAFLGAYLWGLQDIYRRYNLNDLLPGTFYGLGMRMIFASAIALFVFHATYALATTMATNEAAQQVSQSGLLPATAFFIGMFPQRGIQWLQDHIPLAGTPDQTLSEELPLEMIQGISTHDRLRLQEVGIESCHDLALADYIPLLLRTPYPPRRLLNWILQAKMCVRFGPGIGVLREHGFQTLIDLKTLSSELADKLALETALNRYALDSAIHALENDYNLARLEKAAQILSRYWEGEETEASHAESGPTLVRKPASRRKQNVEA